MLTTDGRWILPKSARDLRCQTLLIGEGRPLLGNDGDMVASVQEHPSSDQASDTTSDNEGSVRSCVWRYLRERF